MSRTAAMLLFVFTSALAGNAVLGGPVVVPDTATWVVRLLFVLLAAGALASVVVSGPTRARIAGATVASLLGLLSIEIYEWGFGLFAPPDYPETYDARSKFELVLDMRAGGVEAYPTIHPAAYIAPQEIGGIVTMPFGGVANAVTVYCKENETGQYLVYDSDEMGFNNPRGIWRRTSVEVALIGDSFTQGACVLKGSFAELLRARFDGVLNLGSGNNGPLIELATIREHLAEFRPRTVLWFYYEGNDLFNLAEERQSALLMRYLASDYWQGIRERQSQIDAFVRRFVNRSVEQLRASGSRGVVHEEPYGLREVARLALLQKHLAHIALGGEPSNPPDLRLFARILERAKESVESWGGKLYFVYLPAYELLRRGESEPHREAVLETARSQGLPIVDIDALFQQRADPLDFFPYNQDGVHYTQEGNQLVAEALIRAIESRAD